MWANIRRHLAASAVGYLALLIALGGTSYAAAQIGSKDIKDNAVRSVDVRNGTLQSKDVRNGSLRAKDFKAGELTAGADGAAGPQGPAGPTGPRGPEGPPNPDAQTLDGLDSTAFARTGQAVTQRDFSLDGDEMFVGVERFTATLLSDGPLGVIVQCVTTPSAGWLFSLRENSAPDAAGYLDVGTIQPSEQFVNGFGTGTKLDYPRGGAVSSETGKHLTVWYTTQDGKRYWADLVITYDPGTHVCTGQVTQSYPG